MRKATNNLVHFVKHFVWMLPAFQWPASPRIPESLSVRLCRVLRADPHSQEEGKGLPARESIKSTPQNCRRSVSRDAAAVVCVGAGRRGVVRRHAEGRQAGQGQ